jgi:Transmembrane secretion effector
MDDSGATSLTEATRTVRELLSSRHLRRVQLAFAGFNAAEYGVWVAVLVYAYERGGAAMAGTVAVAQLVPAGLVAPVASSMADRRGGGVALRVGYLLQAGAISATAILLLLGAAPVLVYGAAIAAAGAVTTTRPAQGALFPELVHGCEQLTALSVLSGWVESLAVLVGPALAGVLIALGGPGLAVGCFALCVAASAVLVRGVPDGRVCDAGIDPEAGAGLAGGVEALRDDAGLAALVLVLAAAYVVIGVIDVVVVVLAASDLGLGAPAAGFLNAAFGAGGLLGALATLSLIRRRRLAEPLIAAAVSWSLVLVALGVWPTPVGAFALLAAAGGARSVLDVSARTILLRAAPPLVRGRVFGMLEGVAMLGLAAGSLLVGAFVTLGGAHLVLVVTGLLLSAVALARISQLTGADRAGQLRIAGEAY